MRTITKEILENGIIKNYYVADGTCLQGEIEIDYKILVKCFGLPGKGDGYKVDAEWTVLTPFGVATIYNYKDGKNYCGVAGLQKSKIRNWHIGGKQKEVVRIIWKAISNNID